MLSLRSHQICTVSVGVCGRGLSNRLVVCRSKPLPFAFITLDSIFCRSLNKKDYFRDITSAVSIESGLILILWVLNFKKNARLYFACRWLSFNLISSHWIPDHSTCLKSTPSNFQSEPTCLLILLFHHINAYIFYNWKLFPSHWEFFTIMIIDLLKCLRFFSVAARSYSR